MRGRGGAGERFPSLEGITKILVAASVLAAGAAEAAISFRHIPYLAPLAVIGFLTGLTLAPRLPVNAVSVLLVLAYVTPGLFLLADYRFYFPPFLPWLAAVLGVILSWSWRDARWHLPREWTFPLVFTALVVAVSWPVVVLRELDFQPDLTIRLDVFNNAIRTPAPAAASWAARTALAHGVGLLWLDWLFATFPDGAGAAFRRRIVYPLGLSWLLTSLVAIGQAFVDVRFINDEFWATLRRASGALPDANSFGVLSAIGGSAAVAAILAGSGRARLALLPPALALSWFGVLASGSRSAALIATLALALTGWGLVRTTTSGTRLRLALGLTAGCLLAGITWWLLESRLATPVARAAGMLTSLTPAALASLLADLWTRGGYGPLASQLISRFPFTGVGVGGFHIVAPDHALAFDNAQNWYRHQLVELGVLGSLGWIVWLVVGAKRILGPRAAALGAAGQAVRGILVALAIGSLVGVHLQEAPLILAFWTLVFWAAGPVNDDPPARASRPATRRMAWALLLVVAGIYAAALASVSIAHFRVADRAVAAGWDYSYGFYAPEQVPGVGEVRWTRRQAVAVIVPPGPRFPVTIRVGHPDAAKRPVRVRLWSGRELVMDDVIHDAQPVTRHVAAPAGGSRLALTIRVSRTWRPKDHGFQDARDLGVMVSGPAFVALQPSA